MYEQMFQVCYRNVPSVYSWTVEREAVIKIEKGKIKRP